MMLVHVQSNGLQLTPQFDLNPAPFAIALIILSLAEVFRYGLELQTESDLTV